MTNMKIYVASSWHNIYQQQLVELLKKSHYEVYDFQHPNIKQNGFNWTSIDKNWKEWDFSQYKNALTHPYAEEGFNNDFKAMRDADVCVLLLPCGKSAHTEAGFMAGQGKKVVAMIPQPQEAELMYKLFDKVVSTNDELLNYLSSLEMRKPKELLFLNLIVDGYYYDMILDEIKKEEYREIKPYWIKRLFLLAPNSADEKKRSITNQMLKHWATQQLTVSDLIEQGLILPKPYTHVCFRRGYTNSPLWVKLTSITIGYGNTDWGAPKDKKVFVLRLGEII